VCDQSYVHPPVWTDVALDTGVRTERHREQAPGHDPDLYVSELRTVPAPDGVPVPVTVVRRRDTPLDGTAPCLLYGYGAYEYVFESEWDAALPSLLDRGVVFAHAHVRGGGEGGRRWWLEGRLARKQNTFTDFVAVADGLDGLVDGTRYVSRGLSAGGLLQGAVFSQRPDRWRGVVAEVPFVDVVSTMFDASIPLTVAEWDEWGDPRRREDFDWMIAYSPYDNLPPAGVRPDLLVTGALHDPRVMVWEPAKWVAALRDTDPEWSPRCLFRCELGAGSHVGPSGRLGHLSYEAEVYAWVLERFGA
jgi:oligopeptidase B